MSSVSVTRAASSDSVRHRARRDLVAFLALVVLLSAPFEWAIARTGALADTAGLLLVGPLMLVPALSSVIVRLATRQGFADVSFRLGPRARRSVLRSPLLPLLVGVPTSAIALVLGLGAVNPPTPAGWVTIVIASLVMNLLLVPGEEIGWRGFMVTRLVDAGAPAPLLTSGLLWGMWHVPLVLWGGLVTDGPAPWVSTLLMLVTTASWGYLLARSRMDTGSVWPAIAAHVVWNVLFQAVFEVAVTGRHVGLWLGEAGVLTALAITLVAVASATLAPPLDREREASDRLEGMVG